MNKPEQKMCWYQKYFYEMDMFCNALFEFLLPPDLPTKKSKQHPAKEDPTPHADVPKPINADLWQTQKAKLVALVLEFDSVVYKELQRTREAMKEEPIASRKFLELGDETVALRRAWDASSELYKVLMRNMGRRKDG